MTFLANLGLTTQLVVLGLCLLLDAPGAYLWFALACLVAPGAAAAPCRAAVPYRRGVLARPRREA